MYDGWIPALAPLAMALAVDDCEPGAGVYKARVKGIATAPLPQRQRLTHSQITLAHTRSPEKLGDRLCTGVSRGDRRNVPADPCTAQGPRRESIQPQPAVALAAVQLRTP